MTPLTNQHWSTGAGTRHRVEVTFVFMTILIVISLAFMKVRAIGHSVILHLLSSLFHSLGTLSFRLSQLLCCGHSVIPSLSELSLILLATLFSFHFTISVPLAGFSAIMLRECGKPKRGPQYYSFIARCNRPDHLQSSLPTTNTLGIAQNWLDFPSPSLNAPHSPPPLFDTMLDPGSFPVDEEIPPLEMQPLKSPPEPCIITSPQARPMEQGSCMVEEEIPPNWLTNWIAQNTTPGLAMEEIPPTTSNADTSPHEDTVGNIEQPLLNPHHFSNDHLQRIFDMWRNLEDQIHNQSTFSRHMDLLFDSLSGAPDKTLCPTCGQRFVFTYINDGRLDSPNL